MWTCSIVIGWNVYFCLQRLYETVYVHRFSHSTMPIFNIFKVL